MRAEKNSGDKAKTLVTHDFIMMALVLFCSIIFFCGLISNSRYSNSKPKFGALLEPYSP